MKRMFAILKHPIDYFNLVRLREWIVLLLGSTIMLKIDDPSIWDVDRIHKNLKLAITEDDCLFSAKEL